MIEFTDSLFIANLKRYFQEIPEEDLLQVAEEDIIETLQERAYLFANTPRGYEPNIIYCGNDAYASIVSLPEYNQKILCNKWLVVNIPQLYASIVVLTRVPCIDTDLLAVNPDYSEPFYRFAVE